MHPSYTQESMYVVIQVSVIFDGLLTIMCDGTVLQFIALMSIRRGFGMDDSHESECLLRDWWSRKSNGLRQSGQNLGVNSLGTIKQSCQWVASKALSPDVRETVSSRPNYLLNTIF